MLAEHGLLFQVKPYQKQTQPRYIGKDEDRLPDPVGLEVFALVHAQAPPAVYYHLAAWA